MTVHFIGAGPGAADLLTLRARDLIASCPLCLYAGSLIPEAILAHCPADARLVNTAPLDLDDIISECKQASVDGLDVARLHSGDLSVWSAMGEQLRRLRAENIAVTITPGVPVLPLRRGPGNRADSAWTGPVCGLNADNRTGFSYARKRNPTKFCPHRRNSGHSFIHSQSGSCCGNAQPTLWRGLSGGCCV